jgi:putative FmdB family regulatory protein
VPTYQYACTECSHSFEQFQSFSDDALTECPECQGRLRKLFGAVGVVFKGSGFYRTDSRAANGSSANGSSDGASTGSETKSDATSGSKSESKSESKSGTSEPKSSGSKGDSASKTPAAASSAS